MNAIHQLLTFSRLEQLSEELPQMLSQALGYFLGPKEMDDPTLKQVNMLAAYLTKQFNKIASKSSAELNTLGPISYFSAN